jgi:hypothetical protein
MLVSTSLADFDESIVSQTGVRIFGYGLNMGSELERFKDCVTDQTDLDFYLAFPNPLNSLEEEYRIYPLMITGPCSPFSNTSSPIFLTAFRTPEDFKRAIRLTELQGLSDHFLKTRNRNIKSNVYYEMLVNMNHTRPKFVFNVVIIYYTTQFSEANFVHTLSFRNLQGNTAGDA